MVDRQLTTANGIDGWKQLTWVVIWISTEIAMFVSLFAAKCYMLVQVRDKVVKPILLFYIHVDILLYMLIKCLTGACHVARRQKL